MSVLVAVVGAVRPAPAQESRLGVPGRADYVELNVPRTDPRLTIALTSRDPAALVGLVAEGVRDGDPDFAFLAAQRLTALRQFSVADTMMALERAVLSADPSSTVGIRIAFRTYRLLLDYRDLPPTTAATRLLDTIRNCGFSSATTFFFKTLGRAAADSLRDRFLAAGDLSERGCYFLAMLDVADESFMPLFGNVLAHGPGAYGAILRSYDIAARGMLAVGTLQAIETLDRALLQAESLGTYADVRQRYGYDAVREWRGRRTVHITGHTIPELLVLLREPTHVGAQAYPTPNDWNVGWRRDVAASRGQVSFELGNIEGGHDPRSLVLDSIRLNGAMPALEIRPHAQGNARWTGPWVDIVFRQRDAIELVPLDAREGQTFTAVLTGWLADGTRIRAATLVRLVGQR